MRVTKFTDARGRFCVRVIDGDYTATYVAMDEDDADDYASSAGRQAEDRALATAKLRARLGR